MENFDSMLNVSAVPQDDRTAAFIAESKNNRQKCYELSEQTTNAIAADSGAFRQYLDVQSRFDRYTVNNAILIMAQKPDAQKLGDYGYWRDQGVFVKRMARNNPVLILEPGKEYSKEDGTIGTFYNAKKLYDISQTGMRDKIQPEEKRDEKLIIKALVSSPPVDIVPADADQMPEDKGAVFEPGDNCIYVRKGMDAEQIFTSLAPELVLAGFADGRKDYDRNGDAFHAYCVSYMLCKKYGFDTSEYDFSDAPGMFEGMEAQEVRAELSKSRDALNRINSRMVKVFEQNRSQNPREQGNPQKTDRQGNTPKEQQADRDSTLPLPDEARTPQAKDSHAQQGWQPQRTGGMAR